MTEAVSSSQQEGLDNDQAELLVLFHATNGISSTLLARTTPLESAEGIGAARPPGKPKHDHRSKKLVHVKFLRPPELISTADEAREFNLKYGRTNDCFEFRNRGAFGEGFYLTDFGRKIGSRVIVDMPGLEELAATSSESGLRFFSKTRKAVSGGKQVYSRAFTLTRSWCSQLVRAQVPEARFVMNKVDVEEVVAVTEAKPLERSRWVRLDGWLYDNLQPSFKQLSLPPPDARLRRQRQLLRSDITGWFGVQVG